MAAWVRYSKKNEKKSEFKELEEDRKKIKRLKKKAEEDKKAISTLEDTAAGPQGPEWVGLSFQPGSAVLCFGVSGED